jgi:hypothetical protein
MSKEAGVRAMREARYNAMAARAAASPKPPRPSTPSAPARAPEPAVPEASTEQLCGHRSMNGRTCTREHGHAAKSHRYS